MKKRILAVIAGVTVALSTAAMFGKANANSTPNPNSPETYYTYAEQVGLMEVINSNEPDFWERVENRNGKLIIERCIGEVLDAENGTGFVYNGDPEDNFISYRCVRGIQNGDIICTFFVYNPDTNDADDILHRFDYVIDRKE